MTRDYLAAGLIALALASGISGCHRAATTTPAASDAGDAKGDADAPLPVVKTGKVTRSDFTDAVTATGTLTALRDKETTVSSLVTGVLDAVDVRYGDTVHAGQVVAHLSTSTLAGQMQTDEAVIAQNTVQIAQAQSGARAQAAQTGGAILQATAALANAKAALLSAQAALTGQQATAANARQNQARLKSLFTEGLVAQKDVEAADLAVRTADSQVAAQQQQIAAQEQSVASAQAALDSARVSRLTDTIKQQDVDVARQQLASARGALTTARAQMGQYTLRAPIDGVVTAVAGAIGESIDPTAKLLTIANIDRLQLQISVPTVAVARIRVGDPVTFTVDAVPGKIFRCRISTIGTQIDPANSTLSVTAVVENPGHLLKDDMTADKVSIAVGEHPDALSVPRSAVLFDAGDSGETATVLTLDKDKTVHKRDVKIGLTDGDQVEVKSGLSAGETVITSGGYGLDDGTKVATGEAGDDAKTGAKDKPDAAGADTK